MHPKKITVNDKMQTGYTYERTKPKGEEFAEMFEPDLSPKQMLKLGVFGGKYMTDCEEEFPKSWFKEAKLNSKKHDPKLNFFGIRAS